MSQPYFGQVWGWSPTLGKKWGVGVLRDSQMFKARQQGPKHLTLGCSWCRWKGLEAQISKMASHWPFGHLSPKLWAKEGPRVKLAVWLLTTKSWESTSSRPPNWKCDTSLERWRRGLQVWFKPRRNQTSQSGVMSSQSPRDSTRDNFGTISGLQLGSPGKKSHLDVVPKTWRREYYMGEGGGFPRVRAVVCLVVQSAHGLS